MLKMESGRKSKWIGFLIPNFGIRPQWIPASAGMTATAGIMTIIVRVTQIAQNDVIPAKAGIHRLIQGIMNPET